jgi:hypothetical protein
VVDRTIERSAPEGIISDVFDVGEVKRTLNNSPVYNPWEETPNRVNPNRAPTSLVVQGAQPLSQVPVLYWTPEREAVEVLAT